MDTARFADPEQSLLATGRRLLVNQAEPGRKLTVVAKALFVAVSAPPRRFSLDADSIPKFSRQSLSVLKQCIVLHLERHQQWSHQHRQTILRTFKHPGSCLQSTLTPGGRGMPDSSSTARR